MSDLDTLKQRLANSQWRLHKTISIPTEDGPVELCIRRPPSGEVVNLFQRARQEGLTDEKDVPVSAAAGLCFFSRVGALVLFAPEAIRPSFSEQDVLTWPSFGDFQEDCMAALVPAGVMAEKLKGK